MAKRIGKPVKNPKKGSGMPSSGSGKGNRKGRAVTTKKAKNPSRLEMKALLKMQQQRPGKVTAIPKSPVPKPSKPKNNRDPRNRYSTGGQVSYKHGECPKGKPC